MENTDKKLKVLFDATILNNIYGKNNGRSGIFWVAYNLLKAFSKRTDISVYLYSLNPKITQKFIADFSDEIPNISLYMGDIKDIDLYFSPYFVVPEEIRKTGIQCLNILYDCIPLIWPAYFNDFTKKWFGNLCKSLSYDDYVFTISENTKKDFLKFCPQLDAKKMVTIPLATNLPYHPNKKLTAKIRAKYNIPEDKKYLFSLCSLEPRKNLIRSVQSFIAFIEKNKIDDLVFILGGGAWKGFIEKLESEVPNIEKYKNKIIRAGYVDDEDLEVLYSNAEWFVYTSQYEGFGMPPLEAMACGTAVITSNSSSLPEVVGDAGVMIDWDNDEQHVEAYEKYYFDLKFRQKMAKKGLERSKQFSWEKTANIIVETFKKCPCKSKRQSLILSDLYEEASKRLSRKIVVKLFNFLPLVKIYRDNLSTRVNLFGFLPFCNIKRTGGRKQWKIFGVPVFKIRQMADKCTTKYYIFGLPIMNVKKVIK